MGALHALRWGLSAALPVIGVAALVAPWRVADDRGAAGWWALGLLAAGVVLAVVALVARDRNKIVGVVGILLLAIGATVAGRGLLDPVIPTDAGDRLATPATSCRT